jgi:hypothetical protein
MDEHIGMVKGTKCEVTGSVTGIAADNHVEPRDPEGIGKLRSPPFQAGRKLESNALCPPLPQLPDKIRYIV